MGGDGGGGGGKGGGAGGAGSGGVGGKMGMARVTLSRDSEIPRSVESLLAIAFSVSTVRRTKA